MEQLIFTRSFSSLFILYSRLHFSCCYRHLLAPPEPLKNETKNASLVASK